MQKAQVTFGQPPRMVQPPSRPESVVYHQNIVRPPFSPPLRPTGSPKIQTPPHLHKTIPPQNQNIRIMSPQQQQQKKIDINLNIKVNDDETITVNANGQEFKTPYNPQQPVRVNPPPINRPIMIPNHMNRGGFVVNRIPYQPRLYQYPPPPPPQHRGFVPVQEQKNESVSKKSSSIYESGFHDNLLSKLKHEQKIYCVICEEEYSEYDKEDHIKKHQRRKNENRQFNVDEMIKNYQFKEEPTFRPIVEPQQYNIPYEPNYHHLNFPQQVTKVNQETTTFKEQPHSQPLNSQVPENTSREQFFLDHEEEGIENMDNSRYRQSSMRKRVYDPNKYGQKVSKLNAQSPTRERVQFNEQQEDRGEDLNTRGFHDSSTRHRQYNPPTNSQYNALQSKIPQSQSVRYGQIKEEQEYLQSSHDVNLKHSIPQSYLSDVEIGVSQVRSSQPRVVQPEVPIHEIIREKSLRSSYDEINMSKNGMRSNAGTM